MNANELNHYKWPDELLSIQMQVRKGASCVFNESLKIYNNSDAKSRDIIVSVLSKEYISTAKIWLRTIHRLPQLDLLIISCDVATSNFLRTKGVAYVEFPLPHDMDLPNYTSETGFRSRGLLVTSLKFMVVSRLVKEGRNVILSDVDALLIRDPIPEFNRNCDLAFQRVC